MVSSQRQTSWECFLCHLKVPQPPEARKSDKWSVGTNSEEPVAIGTALRSHDRHGLPACTCLLPGMTVQRPESTFTKPLHFASLMRGRLLWGQEHAMLNRGLL